MAGLTVSPGPPLVYRGSFATSRTTPSAVRAWAEPLLEGWTSGAVVADTLVVLSELVANAVLHGDGDIDVVLRRRGDKVRVEVWDAERRGAARVRVRTGAVDRPSGRGLLIVDRLAHRWGVEPHDRGKVVWAETARNG